MARTKATKLPKRIAGVKLSKKLRKRGGKVLDLLRHPLTADIAAAAMVAMAAAVRESERARKAAGDLGADGSRWRSRFHYSRSDGDDAETTDMGRDAAERAGTAH